MKPFPPFLLFYERTASGIFLLGVRSGSCLRLLVAWRVASVDDRDGSVDDQDGLLPSGTEEFDLR